MSGLRLFAYCKPCKWDSVSELGFFTEFFKMLRDNLAPGNLVVYQCIAAFQKSIKQVRKTQLLLKHVRKCQTVFCKGICIAEVESPSLLYQKWIPHDACVPCWLLCQQQDITPDAAPWARGGCSEAFVLNLCSEWHGGGDRLILQKKRKLLSE